MAWDFHPGKPQISSAFGQKFSLFSHQGWGEASRPLLSAQDRSPGVPRVPWAPSQGTAPAGTRPPTAPGRVATLLGIVRVWEGGRGGERRGAPGGVEPLRISRSAAAQGQERVSAEPLGLI